MITNGVIIQRENEEPNKLINLKKKKKLGESTRQRALKKVWKIRFMVFLIDSLQSHVLWTQTKRALSSRGFHVIGCVFLKKARISFSFSIFTFLFFFSLSFKEKKNGICNLWMKRLEFLNFWAIKESWYMNLHQDRPNPTHWAHVMRNCVLNGPDGFTVSQNCCQPSCKAVRNTIVSGVTQYTQNK